MTFEPSQTHPSRRTLLRTGAVGFAAAFQGLNAFAAQGGNAQARIPNYGPVRPVKDLRTGIKLLRLPRDFQYVSFGWRGDPLTDSDGLLLCEDGGQSRERMHALTMDGQLSLFAQNDIVLNGQVNGIAGNFRRSEWCGATFDPSGQWLFVNIQAPGITFPITGPWRRGPL